MKVLWIVLAVLGCLCLICGGTGFWLFSKGKGAFDEADRFGHDSLQAIAAKWDPKELIQRAAPEVEQQNGKDAMPKLVELLNQKLGPIKGEFVGHVTNYQMQNNNGESTVNVDWNTDATFEKGKGSVSMALISRNGKWEILEFHVDSDLLKGTNSKVGSEDKSKGTQIKIGG